MIVRALDDGGTATATDPAALRRQRGARGRRSARAGGDRDLRAGLQQARADGAASGRDAARLAAQRRRRPAGCAPPCADAPIRAPPPRSSPRRSAPRASRSSARGPVRAARSRPALIGRGGRRHRSGRRSGCIGDADRRAHGRAACGADPGRRPGRLARPLGGRAAASDRGAAEGAAARGRRAAGVRHARVPRRRRRRPPTASACSRGSCPPSSSAATRATSPVRTPTSTAQPPPVAIYAADAARAVLEAVAAARPPRALRWRAALRALPAHDGLLGRWAATPAGGVTPRRLAVLSWPAGRSAPNG